MQHPLLASGRWFEFSFPEQMANVGSEVERTISWKNKGNAHYSRLAFVRALELMDLTITDKRNISKLTELTRTREVLVDYFAGTNVYKSSDTLWQKYFYPFSYKVRKDI